MCGRPDGSRSGATKRSKRRVSKACAASVPTFLFKRWRKPAWARREAAPLPTLRAATVLAIVQGAASAAHAVHSRCRPQKKTPAHGRGRLILWQWCPAPFAANANTVHRRRRCGRLTRMVGAGSKKRQRKRPKKKCPRKSPGPLLMGPGSFLVRDSRIDADLPGARPRARPHSSSSD